MDTTANLNTGRRGLLAISLCIVALGAAARLWPPLTINHDSGWYLYAAGRLLDIEDCTRLGIVEDRSVPYPSHYHPHASASVEQHE